MFFHLRVFDEHKDFETDSKHYPDRVLQSGLISLRDLRILGAIAIGLEIILAAIWMPQGKPAAVRRCVIHARVSILMLKEFFVPKWLNQHFLVYAISHMLIMPLMALLVFSFATGDYPGKPRLVLRLFLGRDFS